jgi:Protein of unknown function (DUF3467)
MAPEGIMTNQPSSPPQPPKLSVPAEVAMGEYSNFVSIAHNYSEVVLDFGRTLPGRQDIPVVARLMMTPFQARQLLRALTHNLQMYEQTFGPIQEPPTPRSPDGGPTNSTN